MQVTETLNEGLKRGYSITVAAGELDAKVTEKLDEARKDFQMKGFRKGKAPASLMKKMFGKQVLGEAVQETIDDAVRNHFEQSGDRPAMQPDIKMTNENWKEGDDIEVSMSYEALPDVPEVALGDIELEKLVVEPEADAVDEALQTLANNAKNYEDKGEGAEAANDDQVVMDFKGSIDGEYFDGGSGEDFPLVLGSGSFIPGFEEQLVGVKAGDERSVEVSFPEEYGAEHLAGKAAVFECAIKEVKAPKAVEVDDELAKRYGADDLDTLKGQIRDRLKAELNQASRAITRRRLMDKLDEAVKFDLPPSLVDIEAKQIAHQLRQEERRKSAGDGESEDADQSDQAEITPSDEHMSLAERRVRLGLLLAELGNKSDITVPDQEVQQAIFEQARQYPGQERQFLEFMQNNPQAIQQIRAPLFEDKVIDYILELAKVEERVVTKDELQKELDALEESDTEASEDA